MLELGTQTDKVKQVLPSYEDVILNLMESENLNIKLNKKKSSKEKRALSSDPGIHPIWLGSSPNTSEANCSEILKIGGGKSRRMPTSDTPGIR